MQADKINLSHAKALRRARELLKVTRSELGQKLNLSPKAIEKYESGRAILDEEKLTKILNALGLKQEVFEKVRRGKSLLKGRKPKTVFKNVQRRSYQKVITKEVRVLRILREMKNLSQDQASSICGYSRPSIGHIENGRITLDQSRIEHIVKSYGYPMSEFDRLMREEIIRDEILSVAFETMKRLSEEKLKIVSSLLQSF
ncbi:MAG: hypothetical protein COW00_10540 [Bdellovibrio sp. CG12_big_fil_rev_8_21_14_0_65_39_13]|nr:MAG: hypothetical protein COW78_00030 [Bdellovibrio sp. CG22_combo_CG10-13_8_21_14_all_39_27]PIQ59386.1 MAG: hypothetical protein COW00_10540 [Bdellovibrio sp. CG12_big_fil_rev_8_21_14_0_65_39_13]PIR34958.1 MAG: hypothetical protein COV37_11905 [Bdellovibrio sp. CG11_big_fil_rev_8_21_14_0_20_39_38]